MATIRKLSIRLCPNGVATYRFDRDRTLGRYLIEHPDELVDILPGTTEGYSRTAEPTSGYTRLTWEGIDVVRAFVYYQKRGKVAPFVEEGQTLFRYAETIRVRVKDPADRFGLWLDGLGQGLSAIRARSTAEFVSTSGHRWSYKPRELSEKVFNGSGELRVDWVLELAAGRARP